MRILHTSDWHLGQHFMGKSRQAEHHAFICWLMTEVADKQVDAVIIAGDIFDTGSPPSYARELYNFLVTQLRGIGVSLVILGGNHDSVSTLGESRALLSYLGTTVIPATASNLADQVLVLNTRDGAPGAIVCAIPFIRARDVMQSQAGQSAQEKQLSLQEAIREHYQAVYQLACEQRTALGLPLPIIATGHLTTVGASASESVREIYVGSLEAFPTSAFPPVDYIALGHIHRPQKVGGHEHIRYSGSPIPLSFDEVSQQKEVLLVDLGPSGLVSVTPLPVPRFQQLASLKGDLTQLPALLQEVAKEGTTQQPVWLEVQVKGDDYLSDLQNRIQDMIGEQPLELLRLRRDRAKSDVALQENTRETLDELSPRDVFHKRLESEVLDDALKAQLLVQFDGIVAGLEEERS